jgi:hypothetical protein
LLEKLLLISSGCKPAAPIRQDPAQQVSQPWLRPPSRCRLRGCGHKNNELFLTGVNDSSLEARLPVPRPRVVRSSILLDR